MISSRLSRIPFRRTFSTSLFNMAPQHRQVAVIGSGPAGNNNNLLKHYKHVTHRFDMN